MGHSHCLASIKVRMLCAPVLNCPLKALFRLMNWSTLNIIHQERFNLWSRDSKLSQYVYFICLFVYGSWKFRTISFTMPTKINIRQVVNLFKKILFLCSSFQVVVRKLLFTVYKVKFGQLILLGLDISLETRSRHNKEGFWIKESYLALVTHIQFEFLGKEEKPPCELCIIGSSRVGLLGLDTRPMNSPCQNF